MAELGQELTAKEIKDISKKYRGRERERKRDRESEREWSEREREWSERERKKQ